ncbi:PAS domain S-box protein [Fulvivirga sp. M361]|uniref:GAF domain-containing protein n=1 Tax=Fulvivirga sp. M361 TaxID=2594266 RepID=UPI00117B2A3F|nr:GAF domain-containing protein [Fulvivirga sp. M361]TRX57771.1 PAS domain S-box protein [Fulvivirga sp. M361]
MKLNRSILFYWNFSFLVLISVNVIIYLFNYNATTWQDELILVALPVLLLLYILGKKHVIQAIIQIRHGLSDIDGDSFSKTVEIKKVEELRETSQAINSIKRIVVNATHFVKSIEDGDLDVSYSQEENREEQVTIHDPLENALMSMRAKMQEIAVKDKERNWISEGLTSFIDLLRADNEDLKSLSSKIISSLVKYTGVNQGGLFIVNREGEDESQNNTWIELVACYAYDREKFLKKRINIGEGMIGQTFLEKQTVHLKAVPSDYVNITSGLGEAPPSNLLIVPLKMNDEVYGLIELASFKELPAYKIELIEKLCENIASTVSNVEINDKTSKLLRDSQQQTEELRAQEEEMRQNQEEMQATQEAIQRKQQELEVSEQRSKAIFENSNDAIVVSDENGKISSLNSSAKELFKITDFDMQGKNLQVQQFVKKFDVANPDFFFKKRRRTKATNSENQPVNVEVYMNKEDLGGVTNYLIYIRDISKEMEKEHQIAENLMYMDELKAELQELKKS